MKLLLDLKKEVKHSNNKNMTKPRLFILFFLMTFLLNRQVKSQTLLQKLSSSDWSGTGTLMGSETTSNMRWQWRLDNSFINLEFQNKRKLANGDDVVFKATAYYKHTRDSTVEGYWFDSRGISFPLKGSISDNTLIINWGSPETEQGMTTYKLTEDSRIHVIDYISQNNQRIQFGEAFYEKK